MTILRKRLDILSQDICSLDKPDPVQQMHIRLGEMKTHLSQVQAAIRNLPEPRQSQANLVLAREIDEILFCFSLVCRVWLKPPCDDTRLPEFERLKEMIGQDLYSSYMANYT